MHYRLDHLSLETGLEGNFSAKNILSDKTSVFFFGDKNLVAGNNSQADDLFLTDIFLVENDYLYCSAT